MSDITFYDDLKIKLPKIDTNGIILDIGGGEKE